MTRTVAFICIAASLASPVNAAPPMNTHDAPERQVRIAVAQILCLDGDRAGNFARIENALIEAKQMGAEIVTFPESSILGWENPAAHKRAYPIPGADSDALCALASKYRVFLCVGLDERDGDRLFDSCLLIDDKGTILLKHRKVNVLPELMTPPYSVGDGVARSVDTRFGRIGMIICADSFRTELVKDMAGQKPDLMLIPYGWAAPEEEWPGHGDSLRDIVQTVARTVHCPVVGTDLVGTVTNGPWSGQVYGGQSVAVGRDGSILFRGKDRDRDVSVISVRLTAQTGAH